MKDEIEEYNFKDHSEIDFVYDDIPKKDDAHDKSDSKDKSENGQSEPEKEQNNMPGNIWAVIIGMTALLLISCLVMWQFSGKESADGTEISSENTDLSSSITDETGMTDESGVNEEIKYTGIGGYLQESNQNVPVVHVKEGGLFLPEHLLILEFEQDETPKQAVKLAWDFEKNCYKLVLYYLDEDSDRNVILAESSYYIDEVMAEKDHIDNIAVNKDSSTGKIYIILTKHFNNGEVNSYFYNFIGHSWSFLGKTEGMLKEQEVEDAEGIRRVIEADGLYLFVKPLSEFPGVYAGQYKTAASVIKPSDPTADVNYWCVFDGPEWYLRRPVLAYADVYFFSPDIIEGSKIQVTGINIHNGVKFYEVTADYEETGYILLDFDNRNYICQVKLQSLPFEEVFAYSTPSEDDITDDPFESFLPVIREQQSIELMPEEQFEAWSDLNGDGIYEKVYARSTLNTEYGSMYVKIDVNGDMMFDEPISVNDNQGINILFTNLDSDDQWSEIGYYYENFDGRIFTELYRYDGGTFRRMLLEKSLCLYGEIDWNNLDSVKDEHEGEITVYGSVDGVRYSYPLLIDNKTGMFHLNDKTKCEFDTPIIKEAVRKTILYSDINGGEEIVIEEGDVLSIAGIYVQEKEPLLRDFFICFNMSDGSYMYSSAVEGYRETPADIINMFF